MYPLRSAKKWVTYSNVGKKNEFKPASHALITDAVYFQAFQRLAASITNMRIDLVIRSKYNMWREAQELNLKIKLVIRQVPIGQPIKLDPLNLFSNSSDLFEMIAKSGGQAVNQAQSLKSIFEYVTSMIPDKPLPSNIVDILKSPVENS